MAPGQGKPQQQQQNGQKKKGYNPYNKFKNRHWKKKKPNNENGSRPNNDGESNQQHSHPLPASPTKIVQTPISILFEQKFEKSFFNYELLFSYLYRYN